MFDLMSNWTIWLKMTEARYKYSYFQEAVYINEQEESLIYAYLRLKFYTK